MNSRSKTPEKHTSSEVQTGVGTSVNDLFRQLIKTRLPIDSYEYENDHVLKLLEKFNLPLTRDNYIGLAYPEGLPAEWSEVDEISLPPEIRL